jgi:uncharacterized protein YdhG (YjbR/CyaY superfamily)
MAIRRTTPKTIDEYIASFPPEVQAILKKIRRTIRAAAPDAQEAISYQIPTFKLQGVLVHFAAFKKHIGFYPPVQGDADLVKAVSPYANAKGNLRFPLDRPIPYDLITRIAKLRVKQNLAAAKAKGRPKVRKHVQYHKNGAMWAKGQVKGGVLTGYWEWFRLDGTILRSGTFENGEQVGEWTTYDKNGKVYKVTVMKRKPG